MKKVLVISGPTATGKSKLAIECAKAYNGEIISGDSVAIYRQCTIGSAKTTIEEQDGIVHHGIDIKDVTEGFSVYEFQHMARTLIDDIVQRGKLPIVVGGTGLYIKALLYDYHMQPMSDVDMSWVEDKTNEQLHQMLKEVDEVESMKIHPNNRKRVIRALTIYYSSKKSKSDWISDQKKTLLYDVKLVGLDGPRPWVYDRINHRVELMIKQGLEEEVRNIVNMAGWDCLAMSAIGYKEFRGYVEGDKTLSDVVEEIKKHTRQFAKRQWTWFNHQLPVQWLDVSQPESQTILLEEVHEWLMNP